MKWRDRFTKMLLNPLDGRVRVGDEIFLMHVGERRVERMEPVDVSRTCMNAWIGERCLKDPTALEPTLSGGQTEALSKRR